jgi:UDP-N-acetylmuramyl pentapeptide phosphotransferase/UDP-N-acetylglucosamine-1-phosphate transferase
LIPNSLEISVYFFAALIGMLLYYRYAKKKQIVDVPNERSSHQHLPVRGMGISLIALFAAFYSFHTHQYFLTLGLIIASITGYLDDLKNLKRRIRLPLYLASLVLALVDIQLLLKIEWYWLGVSIVVALGVINAYNFMDGINGITGLYSIVFLGTIAYVNAKYQITEDIGSLSIAMIVFFIVFGWFNYKKQASAFLGDSGSVAVGLLVVYLLIKVGIYLKEWKIIIFLSVYGVDAVATIVLRILRKENIFKAHRSHLYQNLVNEKHWSHMQVAALYAICQLIINALAIHWLERGFIPSINLFYIVLTLGFIYLGTKYFIKELHFKSSNT